jgi:ribonuclease HI
MESSAISAHGRRKLVIFTDGAARGNPGPSASGYQVFENGKLIKKEAFYNGIATNNTAEYKAIVAALEWCVGNVSGARDTQITLNSDSELAVRQLNGDYKIKSPLLKTLHRKAKELASALKNVEFANLRRSNRYISAVDRSLNALLDNYAGGQQRIFKKPST